MLGGWLPLILVLLVATWVLALGIYLTWKQGKGGHSEVLPICMYRKRKLARCGSIDLYSQPLGGRREIRSSRTSSITVQGQLKLHENLSQKTIKDLIVYPVSCFFVRAEY